MSPKLERTLRHVRHAALAATALLCVACAGWSEAHDWTSPPPAGTVLQRRPYVPPADPAWPHRLWAGPASGAPAAPDARDCQRAPQSFDLTETDRGPQQSLLRERHGGGDGGSVGEARRSRDTADAAAESPVADASRKRAAVASTAPAKPTAPATTARSESEWHAGTSALAATTSADHARPSTVPQPQRAPADVPVTAGVVDDNADFGAYLAYRQRSAHLPVRLRNVEERYLLTVRDAAGRPVNDAHVSLHAAGRSLPLWARTDAGGQVWIHPAVMFDDARVHPAVHGAAYLPSPRVMEVQVSRGGATGSALLTRGQRDSLQVRLDARAPAERARLDLVFLVDATGSMADEIDKLKRSMRAMADQIARLPSRPDMCFALVSYRDRGDAYFVRATDFSADLGGFQRTLGALQAGGGGDYPEAMNEALHTAVHRLSWRGDGATRLVVLVADAPPHLDYGSPTYDDDMQGALARGIKLFAVGASGLDPTGEYVFRQAAQYTGGRFVFLTYANAADPSSGPGRETTHDVGNYSVESLDKLVVRLVREELAKRPAS